MERQKWTMKELNAWDAEGFTEEQIMGICKEIYPIGEEVNRSYTALTEPTLWNDDPFRLYVARGCGLCYNGQNPIGQKFQKAYYM